MRTFVICLSNRLHPDGKGDVRGLRRKLATEHRDGSLKAPCELGGWKDPKTLLTCYQAPDPETMRAALAQRRATGGSPNGHSKRHTSLLAIRLR